MRASFQTAKRWILWGIPVLFLTGAPFHFLYEWSGRTPVIGLIAPVNESVWEHEKLLLFPMLMWWMIGSFMLKKKGYRDCARWFTAALGALLLALFLQPLLYYGYSGALGIEALWVDILLFGASLLAGQLFGLHLLRFSRPLPCLLLLFLFLALFALFAWFTFAPPHVPIFLDRPTGSYGI